MNVYNSLLAFASIYEGTKTNTHNGGICYLLNGEFTRKMSSMISGEKGLRFLMYIF
jgi:hypothetical protein